MHRYLMVVPEFPPEVLGGGGVVFSELAQRYINSGELLIVTGGWSGHYSSPSYKILSQRCILLRLPLVRNRWDAPALRSTLPPTWSSYRLLSMTLRAWKPGAAHLHGIGYLLVDSAARILSAMGTPYLLTNHGMPVSYQWGRRSWLKRIAYDMYTEMFANTTIDRASNITAVSLAEATSFRNAEVIPNGVATVPDDEIREPDLVLCGGVPDDMKVPLIVACGRLAPNKGFDILLLALGQLRQPLRCVIAGADGGELQRLQRIAARIKQDVYVAFTGPLRRDEVAWLMREASLVVIPSVTEPFGLVAFEALAMGARIVATNTGGLGEWLGNRALPATLAKPGSAVSLAQCIRSSLQLGRPTPLEVHAVRQLLDMLSWDRIADQYIQLLVMTDPVSKCETNEWPSCVCTGRRNAAKQSEGPDRRHLRQRSHTLSLGLQLSCQNDIVGGPPPLRAGSL